MNVVLDASGAAEIIFEREKSDRFNEIITKATCIITPDLYVYELSNIMWKYNKIKNLEKDRCIKHISNSIDFIDKFINNNDLWQEALSEGIKNNHSIYDMFYMVCAKRESAVLLTCDTELIDICRKNCVEVCF